MSLFNIHGTPSQKKIMVPISVPMTFYQWSTAEHNFLAIRVSKQNFML
jgi:hypothetical protein